MGYHLPIASYCGSRSGFGSKSDRGSWNDGGSGMYGQRKDDNGRKASVPASVGIAPVESIPKSVGVGIGTDVV